MTPVGSAAMARPHVSPGPTAAARRALTGGTIAYAGLLVALVVLAGVLSASAAPVAFGFRSVIISGGSMGGSLPNGSLVMARWIPAGDVRSGDVILVQEGGAPKMHRVVSLENGAGQVVVHTKGDASASADPIEYVLPERVLVPAYHLPYAGLLLAFIATVPGWLLFVGIPGTALCLVALRSIWLPTRFVGAVAPGRRLTHAASSE